MRVVSAGRETVSTMPLHLIDDLGRAAQCAEELARALIWGREVRAAGHGATLIQDELALVVAQ